VSGSHGNAFFDISLGFATTKGKKKKKKKGRMKNKQ
jgi:hypothetical protein